jgi:hypothetical protein
MVSDIGQRTDIWYHNLWYDHPRAVAPKDLLKVASATVDWLCCTFPYLNFDDHSRFAARIDRYLLHMPGGLCFRTISPRRYIWYAWRTKTHLSAGVSAILDLLAFAIQELYITGFTFYRDKQAYHKGYAGVGSFYHDHSSQRELIKQLIERDVRIRIDEGLREAIKGD